MRRIIFALLVLLFTTTVAMAENSMEWTWDDETMGHSNFKNDFGSKKWTGIYYCIRNTAESYHIESCMTFSFKVKHDGKKVYTYVDEGAMRKIRFGPGAMFYKRLNFNYTGNLTVEGYIEAAPGCGINTGRVTLKVIGYYE